MTLGPKPAAIDRRGAQVLGKPIAPSFFPKPGPTMRPCKAQTYESSVIRHFSKKIVKLCFHHPNAIIILQIFMDLLRGAQYAIQALRPVEHNPRVLNHYSPKRFSPKPLKTDKPGPNLSHKELLLL